MSKKVKSVRVPIELESMNLSSLLKECENYLRDLDSATLLRSCGNKEAAAALLEARQKEMGKKFARMICEAKANYDKLA